MIAPEPGAGINKQTSRLVLLRQNLLVAALIFLGLQIWRPCFYLTDDNLDGGLPFLTEMGHHLLHGQSPFYSDYLFGGHYNLQRDATFFVWHPLYFAGSLLAGTPCYYVMMDVMAFVLVMLTAAGFVNLSWYLRREGEIQISDGWIMFFTLSFTYSVIALATGSSWLNYIVNQGALPWLTLGIVQKNWRSGIGLVALFSVHQILGGHPLAMISNDILLSLFALGLSFSRRSLVPLASWALGSLIAVAVTSPMLYPLMGGFFSSSRALGVTLQDMLANNIPWWDFPIALLYGMALWIVQPPEHVHAVYSLAFCSSIASWCIIPAIMSRAKWRGLQLVALGVLLFSLLMVLRPVWLAEIMMRLPILKSMRWPFRELVEFQFFFHLFLLVRPPGLSLAVQRFSAAIGAFVMVVPMLCYLIPPTLNEMPLGRRLIFSGEFDRYWAQVRPLLKSSDRVAVLMPFSVYDNDNYEKPNALMNTFNYAMLSHVINANGYTHTPPSDQLYTQTAPYYPNGAYDVRQKAALLQERPDLKFITLESLHPVRITLSSANGPTIDLTPYVPEWFRHEGP